MTKNRFTQFTIDDMCMDFVKNLRWRIVESLLIDPSCSFHVINYDTLQVDFMMDGYFVSDSIRLSNVFECVDGDNDILSRFAINIINTIQKKRLDLLDCPMNLE